MNGAITVQEDDRSITISFTRAEKRNALDVATALALGAALDDLEGTSTPLVLRSATSGMFVAGTDVAALRARTVGESLARMNAGLFARVAVHSAPTVAVVDGWALGGGLELALACDFRISTPEAQWGLPEVRLGLIPSGGGLHRLARLIGGSLATDLVLSGRRIDGEEAHRIGLAQRLAEPDSLEDCLAGLLEELQQASPLALRLAKEAMSVTGDAHRLVDAVGQALCIADEETQKRLRAFLNE